MIGIVRKMCLPAVVSLLAVSCTSRIDADGSNTGAITFQRIHAETKAIVSGNELPAGSRSFVVWGWHGDGTDVVNDFESVKVEEKDSKWTYDGDLRFWEFGKTYDFYAVFPSEISGTTMKNVDDSGNISITSFDCSKTGEDIVDLMTASNKGIIYNEGDDPQPVSLTFSHELARLKFVVKAQDGLTVTVTGAKLYGVIFKGDFNSLSNPVWTPLEINDIDNTTFKYVPENPQPLTPDGINLFSEMLVIPSDNLDGVVFEMTYYYDEFDKFPVTKKILVNSSPVKWEKGKSCQYNVTIGPNSIQFIPVVTPWNQSTGGIITVE